MNHDQPQDYEYDLSISYSSADSLVTVHGRHFRLIDHLKDKLESHVHPDERVNGRPRRFRVCTFEEDFELKDDLDSAIQDRIRSSRALLVISSKAAEDSHYVHQELAYLARLGSARPVLAGLWTKPPHQAFPEHFEPDAIAANLAPSVVLSFDDWLVQLENESHKVVADVWDLPLTEVHDRFERERSKRRRRVMTWASLALVLVLALGTLALAQARSIRRQSAHDRALARLANHGFETTETVGDGVALLFAPEADSKLADPFLGHATRGIQEAARLKAIDSVRLRGAAVTDAAVEALTSLPAFDELWLERADVSDASVPAIGSLESLKRLELHRTRITKTGATELKKALPGAEIRQSEEGFVDLSGWEFGAQVASERAADDRPSKRHLSDDEWRRVIDYARGHAGRLGFPERREDSLLIGSFNIRRLGPEAKRTRGAWLFLAKTLQPFDLVGIQETLANDEGIRLLADLLGPAFELYYSPPRADSSAAACPSARPSSTGPGRYAGPTSPGPSTSARRM